MGEAVGFVAEPGALESRGGPVEGEAEGLAVLADHAAFGCRGIGARLGGLPPSRVDRLHGADQHGPADQGMVARAPDLELGEPRGSGLALRAGNQGQLEPQGLRGDGLGRGEFGPARIEAAEPQAGQAGDGCPGAVLQRGNGEFVGGRAVDLDGADFGGAVERRVEMLVGEGDVGGAGITVEQQGRGPGFEGPDFGRQRGGGVDDDGNRGDLDAPGHRTEYRVGGDGRGTRERHQGGGADAAGAVRRHKPFEACGGMDGCQRNPCDIRAARARPSPAGVVLVLHVAP